MKDLYNPVQRREFLSDIPPILQPALQFGGLCGIPGLLVGATVGVLRSKPPLILAIATGIQWFIFGSAFTASRSLVLNVWVKEKDQTQPRDKMLASSIAGGIAGSTAGALRGPRSVIPGGVIFAILGAAGQKWQSVADARHSGVALENSNSSNEKTWLYSKWSPLKVLSDVEYEKMLQEKLLRIDTEIGMVDEGIQYERNISARTITKSQDAGKGNT